jgi:hypothetical protein
LRRALVTVIRIAGLPSTPSRWKIGKAADKITGA